MGRGAAVRLAAVLLAAVFGLLVIPRLVLGSSMAGSQRCDSANAAPNRKVALSSKIIELGGSALLVTAHRAVLSVDLASGQETVLRSGEDVVYYSTHFTLDHSLLVSRRKTHSSATEQDDVVDIFSNASFPLISRFTHDVVAASPLHVVVADTASGAVQVHSRSDFSLLHTWKLFTREDHINTITPVEGTTTAWIVLHGRGRSSSVVLIDYVSGVLLTRLDDIGSNSHHWIPWRGGFLSLSSRESALVWLLLSEDANSIAHRRIMWQGPEGFFLKGLAVHRASDSACFSQSPLRATAHERAEVQCTVICVALQEESSSFAIVTHALSTHTGLVNSLLFSWQECHRPRALESSLGWGIPTSPGFSQLRVRFDVAELQREVTRIMDQVPWTHRADVNNYFITLVTKNGDPTDEIGSAGPYAPVPGRVQGYLEHVLANLGVVVGRTRLMLLRPGESVKPHVDRIFHVRHLDGHFKRDPQAGYWGRRVRIHVPVFTHRDVRFLSGQVAAHLKPGNAYLFDKSTVHSVENPSNVPRVHLVVDAVAGVALDQLTRGPLVKKQGDTPVYEAWEDAPVFDAMAVESVSGYLTHVLVRVPAAYSDRVAHVFNRYVDAYSRSPESAPDLLSEIACDPVLAGVRLGANGTGMRLWHALEPFVRQLNFSCSGQFDGFVSVNGPPCFQQQSAR